MPPNLPPQAKRKAKAQSAQDKVSRFHASRGWGKVRDDYKQKQPICERCRYLNQLDIISTRKLEVHHIISVARCWERRKDESNLLTLCRRCHAGYFTPLERAFKFEQAEHEGQEIKDRR